MKFFTNEKANTLHIYTQIMAGHLSRLHESVKTAESRACECLQFEGNKDSIVEPAEDKDFRTD